MMNDCDSESKKITFEQIDWRCCDVSWRADSPAKLKCSWAAEALFRTKVKREFLEFGSGVISDTWGV